MHMTTIDVESVTFRRFQNLLLWRLPLFSTTVDAFVGDLETTARVAEEDSVDRLLVEAAAPWDAQSKLAGLSPAWGSAASGMAGAGFAMGVLQSMVRYWMPKTPHFFEFATSLSNAHCSHQACTHIRFKMAG